MISLIVAAVLFTAVKDWERDLDTASATDPSVENMGDDAHAVPITPEAALSIGQSASIDGLRVTVTGTGIGRGRQGQFLPSTDYMYFEMKYTVENTSAIVRYPNPPVDSQLQYMEGGVFLWKVGQEKDCSPSLKNGVRPLASSGKYECRSLYIVSKDEQPLYWVYFSRDRESCVVFRIR